MSSIPYSQIIGVKFHIAGTDEIIAESCAAINSREQYKDKQPYPGGVNDAHMGSTDHAYACQTCFNNKVNCLGHSGHIALNYPVINPITLKEMRKWLKLICFVCGNVTIPESAFKRFRAEKRLDEASKLARQTNRGCVHCGAIHPIIKKRSKNENLIHVAESTGDDGLIRQVLYPHKIQQILSKVTDQTVMSLGKSRSSHPRNYILGVIRVPPVAIRPDVKKMTGARSSNDDLTTMLQVLVSKNEMISPIIPEEIDMRLEAAYFALSSAHHDFIQSDDEKMNSLTRRMKGKGGRVRKNQLGKRTRRVARATLIGDRKLRIYQTKIPIAFARAISLEEVVTPFNMTRMLGYIKNGRAIYPGATKIRRHATGIEYDVEAGKTFDLEVGDVVMRDLIEGDKCYKGRQPTLAVSNISCMDVVIGKNPHNVTFGINVTACPWFDADFDGDAMNATFIPTEAGRAEIGNIASVDRWFISFTSNPVVGQIDDSLIGISELTRDGVKFDKYHMCLMFADVIRLPYLEPGKTSFTGRDCITKSLELFPISFNKRPKIYDPAFAPWINYQPGEIMVKIDKGVMLSGVLDKKSVGKGAVDGLYHQLAIKYGNKIALDVLFDHQQLAIAYILQQGYTVGLNDLVISDNARKAIGTVITDIHTKSQLITDKLNKGEILPPIGESIESFYENEQINALRTADDFVGIITSTLKTRTNGLFKLISTGSKGDMDNLYSMLSALGQKLINGKRLDQKFGFRRTFPYTERFSTSPQSRGFIANSFIAGLNLLEYLADAYDARFAIITKVLTTSVTGWQSRKSIKNLESLIISHYRWCVKQRGPVIQIAYGEDNLDPRFIVKVKLPTVMISDADFTKKYAHPDFPEFFEKMKQDRDKFRAIYLNVERMNISQLMPDSVYMPVDIPGILLMTPKADKPGDLAKLMAYIDTEIEDFPYIMLNEKYRQRRGKIYDHLRESVFMMQMQARSYLHPNAVLAAGLTELTVQQIFDEIKIRYSRALIDPGMAIGIVCAQSYFGPLTQYLISAHHRAAAGGTNKSGITRAREVLGAMPVESLKSPSMLLAVTDQYARDKARVQEFANNIESMTFEIFIQSLDIFVEKYGEPIHPRFIHEAADIARFNKLNPILTPPGDLSRWCIRIGIDKTMLILKDMSIELIVSKLREAYADVYIMYTPENSKSVYLRIYMRQVMYKAGSPVLPYLINLKNEMMTTIIRGIPRIASCRVIKMLRNKIDDTGAVVRDENLWGIETSGTNMYDISKLPFIEPTLIQTDAIMEVYHMLGIEAARQKIITELRNIAVNCNHRHYMTYADEMTYMGIVTNIETSGLKTRDSKNILLRMGSAAPIAVISEAGINSAEDKISGVTAPLLVGGLPRVGTMYSKFTIDEEFIRANTKSAESYLDQLL